MGFFKIFAFLIGSQEEVHFSEESDDNEDSDYDYYENTEITFISNDGLDGGEVIVEPSYVKN